MIKKKIKSEQVFEFLKKNPDFFVNYPNLLDKINFPKSQIKKDNNIIPFKDWMIDKLKKVQRDIVENAKHNFLTQKIIHTSVIDILKIKKIDEFFNFINKNLPEILNLEIVSFVVNDSNISQKYNIIFKEKAIIQEIYGTNNQLIMDAVDIKLGIFNDYQNKIYSNAIFSIKTSFFEGPSLLVYGSKDKHFIDNQAYDLILFFSKVIQEKLSQLSNAE